MKKISLVSEVSSPASIPISGLAKMLYGCLKGCKGCNHPLFWVDYPDRRWNWLMPPVLEMWSNFRLQ
ncbi:hypothetical protein QT342_05070 [Escherichia coli]|uniref:hypothetical protein n=1 Tax=Escherichia coli TaxID=562 RepID=UPI00259D1308|nr:hypothetical protein [Escherichia coli]MDM4885915.1 hypothetical protein [Escherichia coli]